MRTELIKTSNCSTNSLQYISAIKQDPNYFKELVNTAEVQVLNAGDYSSTGIVTRIIRLMWYNKRIIIVWM